MKVIILAGGFGTRLGEYTDLIPKPMVKIGDKPILWHLMKSFASFGHTDFYVELGYKSEAVKEYFLNYTTLSTNFKISLKSGEVFPTQKSELNWNVTLVDTGLNTMTGGRVKRLSELVGNETCIVTYGDGLADIDINELIAFHKSHGKTGTVTAVHPVARFGELELNGDQVVNFREKPQMQEGWISGGYFVFEPEIFDLILNDETFLEREPLETLAAQNQLYAFKHEGFWQCMDTKRDHEILEHLWKYGAPWER